MRTRRDLLKSTVLGRRPFLKLGAAAGIGAYLFGKFGLAKRAGAAALPGGTLDPTSIEKYTMPLVIPPAMPRTSKITKGGAPIDYYEIAVRQFQQLILPPPLPPTTVWSYGSINHPSTFNYPAFTIEAEVPHAGSGQVDQRPGRRERGLPAPSSAGGPDAALGEPAGWRRAEIRGHVHGDARPVHGPGAHRDPPARRAERPGKRRLPRGVVSAGGQRHPRRVTPRRGRSTSSSEMSSSTTGVAWEPGTATFQYQNNQRAATLWYHDHTLGMTRLNVYAGPAGFYLLRGGPADLPVGLFPVRPRRWRRPARQVLRNPDRDPGPLLQQRWLAVLSGQPGVLRWIRGPVIFPRRDVAAHLEPGVLRQHHGGQRANLALPGRGAAPLSAPHSQRLQLPFPDPEDRHRSAATRPASAVQPFWQIGGEGGFLRSAPDA